VNTFTGGLFVTLANGSFVVVLKPVDFASDDQVRHGGRNQLLGRPKYRSISPRAGYLEPTDPALRSRRLHQRAVRTTVTSAPAHTDSNNYDGWLGMRRRRESAATSRRGSYRH
jgi:hypothetical protein